MLEIKKKGKQYNVLLTRGDSAYITFNIADGSGEPIELSNDDIVRCQVRRAPNGGELLFSGVIDRDDAITWHIRPEDTKALDVGDYCWDCEVEFSNGDIFTFIPESVFTVANEVTEVTL